MGFDRQLLMSPQEAEDEAREYLAGVEARLGARGFNVASKVKFGHAVAVIAETAAQEPTVAIVMATHGRTALERILMGSVATGVVRHSTVPVVVTRPTVLQPVAETAKRPAKVSAFQLARGF